MAFVRELLTKIGFEVEHEKLEGVEKQLEGIKKQLEFLTAVEVLKGIVELTEKFAHFAEELHVASQNAGLTVEEFQKLSFAAGQNAVSQEEMSGAMGKLSRNLYEARNGSQKAQEAFAKVGITPGQLASFHTSKDALIALSDRFKGIEDPIKKQALAMELMGRGSRNMVSFLSKGSAAIGELGERAGKLGIVMSGKDVEALVKVEHAFTEIYSIIKSVGAVIASALAPEVTYIINEMEEWWMVNQKVIKEDLREYVGKAAYALGFLVGIFETAGKAIWKFLEAHPALMKLAMIVAGVVAALGAMAIAFVVLGPIVSAVMTIIGTAIAIATSPITLFIIALGLIVVAIHDLWNAAHGKPTWIQAFIDWLGVGKEVEAVCFAIFDVLKDIFTLSPTKMFNDIKGDIQGVKDYAKNFFHGGKKQEEEQPAGPAPAGGGFLKGAFSNLLGVQNASQGPVPSQLSPTPTEANSNYSISAPITVNVPSGASGNEVAKAARDGVKEHLDRVYRETHAILKPQQAY
jgi:hypothetical protein